MMRNKVMALIFLLMDQSNNIILMKRFIGKFDRDNATGVFT
jgi:hypothetical protein